MQAILSRGLAHLLVQACQIRIEDQQASHGLVMGLAADRHWRLLFRGKVRRAGLPALLGAVCDYKKSTRYASLRFSTESAETADFLLIAGVSDLPRASIASSSAS